MLQADARVLVEAPGGLSAGEGLGQPGQGACFTLRVPDRTHTGQTIREAGLANEDKLISLAASSNPSILEDLPVKEYKDGCPAFELKPRQALQVNVSNLNLIRSVAYDQLAKRRKGGGGIALASWAIAESRDEHAPRRIDVFGLLTSAACVFCLVLAMGVLARAG